MIQLKKIDGISIDYTSNIELTATGNSTSLSVLKAMLTIKNKSIEAQLSSMKRIVPRSQRHAMAIHAQMEELKAKEIHTAWAENPDGSLSIPPGYWFLGDIKGSSHLGDVSPVFMEDERYYQKEIVSELLKYKRSSCSASTGIGKSLIIRDLAISYRKAGQRVMICVPSVELLEQTAQKVDSGLAFIGEPKCGRLGDSKKPKDGAMVVLSTIQSALNHVDKFDAVIFDECFLENEKVLTQYGPMSFKDIWNHSGELSAKSWNEKASQWEWKPITAKHRKKRDRDILRITTSTGAFNCTDNHKFLTTEGIWKEAKDLVASDSLVTSSAAERKPSLFIDKVREQILIGSYLGDGCIADTKNRQRCLFTHGIKQETYCKEKLKILCGSTQYTEKNGFAQTPAIKGSSASFRKTSLFDGVRKGFISPSLVSRMDWLSIAIWIMDDGSFSYNKQGEVNSLTIHTCSFELASLIEFIALFNEKFETHASVRNYDNYPTVIFNQKDAKKIKETIENLGVLDGMYKFQTDKRVLIPDALFESEVRKVEKLKISAMRNIDTEYVYDIEVADNHNFLLECGYRGAALKYGNYVVAHNCHIMGAESYQAVAAAAINAEYMHGLTATIDRPDGLTPLIHAWCGPIVYSYPYKKAVEDEFLSPIKYYSRMLTSNARVHKNMHAVKEYIAVHSDKTFIDELESIVQKSLAAGRKTLVLFKASECCDALAARFGVSAANGAFRKPLDDFKKGKAQLLIGNVALLSTGWDCPQISSIIYVASGTSEIVFMQSIGRGTRICEGKKDCVVIDVSADHGKYINQGKVRKRIAEMAGYEILT